MVYLGFALVGLALAGVNAVHPRRPFVVLFLVYAAVCVGSFVTPGSPLGNNIGRFFMVFGLPLLLLLRHTRLRRPFRYGELAIIPIVAVRAAAGRHRDQPLPQRRRAAADHARLLRPGARRRQGALRPRLPVPRRRAAPPLGGALLPGGRLPHHARLVPPGGRHPQQPLLHALRRGRVRRPGCRAWACSTSSRRWRVRSTRGASARRACWRARRRSPSSSRRGPGASTGCSTRSRSWCRTLSCGRRPPAPSGGAGDHQLRRARAHRLQCHPARDVLAQVHLVAVLGARGRAGHGGRRGRTGSWTCTLRRAGTYTLRFEVTPARVLDVLAGRFGL